MNNEVLYHGTKKTNANVILSSSKFNKSRGDRHWLGDGIYFYLEEFYAYNWLVYECKKNITKYDEDYIKDNYGIISVDLSIQKSRIFDLTYASHKILLDETINSCKKKDSKRFNNHSFPEGVALNILFNELKYSNNYDLIVALFTERRKNYKNGNFRLNYIPEKQYCVVNDSIISNFKNFNFDKKVKEYMSIIEKLYYVYPNLKNDDDGYITGRTIRY